MSEIPDLPMPDPPARRIAVVCPDASVDASYLAAALARHLAQPQGGGMSPAASGRGEGDRVVLIDGQPGTGGLDVILDLETAPGARWPAMCGAGLEIDALKLLRALPSRDGVAVLSHSRRADAVDEAVQLATCGALASVAAAVVMTSTPHSLPTPSTADALLLVVRGTVASMAAAEAVVQNLDDDLPCGLLVLEADTVTRVAVVEALGVSVAAVAPARWVLGSRCAKDVLRGRWPAQSDRTMSALLDGALQFVTARESSPAWA